MFAGREIIPYSHLQCEYCTDVKTTARGLYFHLRHEHGFEDKQAYESVGNSLRHCRDSWGEDSDLVTNATDWTYNKVFWRKHFESEDIEFFDKRDFEL